LCKSVSEIPFTFTHEEYTDMYFVYGTYNRNGKAIVAEYW